MVLRLLAYQLDLLATRVNQRRISLLLTMQLARLFGLRLRLWLYIARTLEARDAKRRLVVSKLVALRVLLLLLLLLLQVEPLLLVAELDRNLVRRHERLLANARQGQRIGNPMLGRLAIQRVEVVEARRRLAMLGREILGLRLRLRMVAEVEGLGLCVRLLVSRRLVLAVTVVLATDVLTMQMVGAHWVDHLRRLACKLLLLLLLLC